MYPFLSPSLFCHYFATSCSPDLGTLADLLAVVPVVTRSASHAGSWYSSSKTKLDAELSSWLAAVPASSPLGDFPTKSCKAVISPHAGYSYSGPPAAYAYKSIDTTGIKRVFILGPSHHAYLDGCALSQCDQYETPVGNLPLDLDTIDELRQTGEFEEMSLRTDEDEHSIEMQLPYIRKIFAGQDIQIVPILVGSISTSKESHFGRLLAPYLSNPSNLFVISTDFCHWGSRFNYTYYLPPTSESASSLSRSNPPHPTHPIHASIEAVDKQGMAHIAFSRPPSLPPTTPVIPHTPSKLPSASHNAFAKYLKETRNTICGRHPIGVLLGALKEVEGEEGWEESRLEWVRYEQSSRCVEVRDSSVSYASGRVVLK
ncbi:UPF0103-domain-containing protein [Pseudohyphozyma bogoriensis]|nr:UPF0103-domain-containing protein [Pseudohyphozyma bogoriensis]